MFSTRREFMLGLAAASLAASRLRAQMKAITSACPFRLAVINDEISPDFDHACAVAAKRFRIAVDRTSQHVGKDGYRS